MTIKQTILTLVMCCAVYLSALGQEAPVLNIVVDGPHLVNVQMKYKDGPLGPVGNITLDAGWKLKIDKPNDVNLRVIIQNKAGNDSSTELTSGFENAFPVDGRKFHGITLAQQFNISVFVDTVAEPAVITCTFPPGGGRPPDGGKKVAVVAVVAVGGIGSMLNDALTLADESSAAGDRRDILAFYADTSVEIAAIRQAYKGNHHLENYTGKKIGADPSGKTNGVKSIIGGIGGLDVTTLALGLSDFIIKRTKEELNVTFFTRFKEFIADPRYVDLQTIFPSTWQTLNLIGEDIYNYNRYLQTLQNAFKADLDQLPANLPGIVDNHPYFFTIHPEFKASLLSSLYVAEGLRDGVHPGKIIDDYDASLLDNFTGNGNDNFKTAVEFLQLLSFSLRDKPDAAEGYWAEPELLRKVLSNETARTCFLGLLYQYGKTRFQQLTFTTGNGPVDVLENINNLGLDAHKQEIAVWETYLRALMTKTQRVHNLIKHYEGKSNDSLKVEQLYTYFQASIDVLQYATNITQLPGISVPQLKPSTAVYFQTATASASLIVNINRANYVSAMVDLQKVYTLVRNRDHDQVKADMESKIAAGDTLSGPKAGLPGQLQYENEVGNFAKQLFRYGTFVATLADADSPQEVSDAVEAFALPSGSARIKRESPFNVSLNAYAGLYVGYERIQDLASDQKVKPNAYGLTVPIGVAISSGARQFLGTGEGRWSYSLFLSLIDLGAVAAFRFRSDTVNEVPSIQLKDIFSPGLFFSVGIPKCPISVNLGAQVGPNLRKVMITEGENDYQGSTYVRYSLSILVDIPIFNFYTRSKN